MPGGVLHAVWPMALLTEVNPYCAGLFCIATLIELMSAWMTGTPWLARLANSAWLYEALSCCWMVSFVGKDEGRFATTKCVPPAAMMPAIAVARLAALLVTYPLRSSGKGPVPVSPSANEVSLPPELIR